MYLQYLKTNYIVGPLSFLILQNIFKGAEHTVKRLACVPKRAQYIKPKMFLIAIKC